MSLIDTHVHLDDTRYDADRDALIARARSAGVEALVTIGTTQEDSRWVASYVAGKQDLYGTVGIHPGCAAEWDPRGLDELRDLAQKPGIVAIGEVGLDFHRPEYSLGVQEPVFRTMIALARELSLPLVIHNRQADRDTLRVLREAWDPALGGVFHCFAGDAQCAQEAVELGFHLAVGGVLTFKSANGLRDIIKTVPMERLVLETDGPWLAPQAQRGQRNEPAFITSVAAQLAEVKGLSLADVETATTANAKRLFRIQS